MRLINASTMLLETFHDAASRPPYAILSHRWIEGDEVTFDDMQRPHRQWMPAWPKIRMCCQQALADGVNYAWVDTCCIDRASSAELSEAINSMYTWYADADRCYVYLNDVDCMQYERLDASLSAYPSMPAEVLENVIASNWFTRAWTLQELLAPIEVILYDVNFRHLGSKIDFATEIEHAFAIPAEVLMNPQRLWEYPIAVRMSWAAYRKATRVEDIAYSLFGLFGVNLPLLYGEGVRAFVRLQDEIIRQTHDHSIFVWNREMTHEGEMSDQHNTSLAQLPLLASSPSDFVDSRDVILTFDTGELRPYAMTNVGLQIELKVIPFDLDVLLCLLHCKSRTTGYQYAMLVVKNGDQTNTWRRLCVKEVDIVDVNHPKWAGNFVWQKLYVVKGNIIATSHRRGPHPSESLRSPVPFYGINIHAPAFLTAEGEAHRPYILVAHHDWDNKSRLLKADVKGDHCNPEYKAEIGARLSRASQIGPAVSIDQTVRLSGLWTFTCRNFDLEHLQSSETSKRRLEHAPGVLAMPLMSRGTAGMVIFESPVHGIQAIKASFDLNFRPTVFIATHEAEIEPWIRDTVETTRYIALDSFEKASSRCNNHSTDEDTGRRFWFLGSDYITDQSDLKLCEDRSIIVREGVHAFTISSTSRTESENWVFKPFENEHWHLKLALQKRKQNGIVYWEFTIDKNADRVKLDFQFDLVS